MRAGPGVRLLICRATLALLALASSLSCVSGGRAGTSPPPAASTRPIPTVIVREIGGIAPTAPPPPTARPKPAPSPTAAPVARARPAPSLPAASPSPDPSPQRLASLGPADLLARLSLPDKVGQLLLAGFDGPTAAGAQPLLRDLRVGGLVLVANAADSSTARQLISELRTLGAPSGLTPPLLIAVDHEGGGVQRIRGGMSELGPNWALGQILSPEAAIQQACRRGAIHGRELREIGIDLNLAPVLDVWSNPRNTVIGDRSYSADPDRAASLGQAYIEALQGAGVLAVAKHFPGHGATTEDSHQTLPTLSDDRATIERRDLPPFRAAIAAGVAGIMTAHVSYPGLDATPDQPASLSPTIVDGLLRTELGFDGLVLTDDLGAMQAITARLEAGEAAVRAIEAGADLLIVVGPYARQRRMVEALTAAVGNRISTERLDRSVRRILEAKAKAGRLEAPTSSPQPPRVCASS